MISYLLAVLLIYLVFAAHFCFLFALELAFPRGKPPSRKSRYRALLFALIAAPAIVAGSYLVGMGARNIGIPPLVTISADTIAGTALATIAVLFVADLFQYWLHRAQHASPFLWRFHSVHHSVEEMGALSGYHHVTEPFIHAAVIGIPLAVIFSSPTMAAVIVIVQFQGNYLHSATRVNFGPLARLIVDNRVHRIHHSKEPRHFDKNFGTFTLLWDWLFGTAYFPKPAEWPDTGVEGAPETKTVRQYLLRPFLRRSGRVEVGEPGPAFGSVGRSKDASAILVSRVNERT